MIHSTGNYTKLSNENNSPANTGCAALVSQEDDVKNVYAEG